jgi:DNA-binding NarL/FixJ family response regulator
MDKGEKPIRLDMKRILIVEDNAYFLQFLKETLHSRIPSVEIIEAGNGEEALQKIKASPPDAILMDLRLPGENGLELTKKIKARYPDIIVVILTNYDLPEYREAAYQSGANHFLSKDSFLKMIDSISAVRNRDQDDLPPGAHPKGGRITVDKILIVEDSTIFRTLLKETLQSRFPSVEILEAADGRDAMQKLAAHLPDVIFMDVKLPGESGLDLTAKIKAKHPNVIIIILTSYDTPEYREAAGKAQANYFLAKGSSSKESILTLVESILAGRQNPAPSRKEGRGNGEATQ